jgi:hypothetical protein
MTESGKILQTGLFDRPFALYRKTSCQAHAKSFKMTHANTNPTMMSARQMRDLFMYHSRKVGFVRWCSVIFPVGKSYPQSQRWAVGEFISLQLGHSMSLSLCLRNWPTE